MSFLLAFLLARTKKIPQYHLYETLKKTKSQVKKSFSADRILEASATIAVRSLPEGKPGDGNIRTRLYSIFAGLYFDPHLPFLLIARSHAFG